MQPKSLLRLPAAASKLEDLTTGTFRPVIDDPVDVAEARCGAAPGVLHGQDLLRPRRRRERPANVAIVRVEELAPWPREVGEIVDQYPNVEEVVWAQEEPKNMGAWTYVQPRLRASIGTVTTLRYIGRPERSSPAEGYQTTHDVEQARIVKDALTYAPASKKQAGVSAIEGRPPILLEDQRVLKRTLLLGLCCCSLAAPRLQHRSAARPRWASRSPGSAPRLAC